MTKASYVCHWQLYWSPRERAEAIETERELAAREGRPPRRIPPQPLPGHKIFRGPDRVEKFAAELRAAHGENVAVTIEKVAPPQRSEQLSLANDWPEQRRSPLLSNHPTPPNADDPTPALKHKEQVNMPEDAASGSTPVIKGDKQKPRYPHNGAGAKPAVASGSVSTIDNSALEGGPEIANGRSPFPDLEAALGLDDEGVAVSELLVTVACRKPKPPEFFRVHRDQAMARAAYVYIDREEIGGETYFVMPEARPYIAEHLRPVLLVTCVNRQNVPFLWPIMLPDPSVNNGRQNRWGASALEAMKAAKDRWVKMIAGNGAYRLFVAENNNLPEPQWPNHSFVELLGICFKETIIADQTHPIVRRLRGQT